MSSLAHAGTGRRKCQPPVAGSCHFGSGREPPPHPAQPGLPGALILDVTSRGAEPGIRLSPFYPHGGIPVPGHPDRTSQSVEGIWQALKVFAAEPEDFTKLDVATMKGIKRTARRLGPPLGHRLDGGLLSYEQARRLIYLPTYHWMLDHRAAALLTRLRELTSHRTVVLLDYTTNGDVTDLSTRHSSRSASGSCDRARTGRLG
jgi:hypothetical protein